LQRAAGSRLEIVERRSEARDGHGQSSDLRAGPKGPATETLVHSTELSRSVSSPPLWICCGKCVNAGKGAGEQDVTTR
jgi:hypothetical protein